MPSFSDPRRLKFVITLGTGTFGQSTDNQITLEGFRSSVDIDKAGGMMMGQLRAKVFGVLQHDMDSITTLVWQPGAIAGMVYMHNKVEVFANNHLIFSGNIVNAWADYAGMPDVFLHIEAQSGYLAQLLPVPPRSFSGSVDVVEAMKQLAQDMNLAFEDNGPTGISTKDSYLPNTALEQAKSLAQEAGLTLIVDDGTLAICKPNGWRTSAQVPVISAASGMVGYPTFDGAGVIVQTLFDPAIRFQAQFDLITDQTRAAGRWVATSVSYRLDSEKPGGSWFTTVRGNFKGEIYVGK